MKKLLLFTTTLAFLFLLTGCWKEKFKPDYHKNIFRCKVNGVEWVAYCPSQGLWGCEAVNCQYYWMDTKGFEIGAVQRTVPSTTHQNIFISTNSTAIGDNKLPMRLRAFIDWNKPENCGYYDLDTTKVNRVSILEVDTINYIIKGTFEFTAVDNYGECMDTVRITDGFFHVNYRF